MAAFCCSVTFPVDAVKLIAPFEVMTALLIDTLRVPAAWVRGVAPSARVAVPAPLESMVRSEPAAGLSDSVVALMVPVEPDGPCRVKLPVAVNAMVPVVDVTVPPAVTDTVEVAPELRMVMFPLELRFPRFTTDTGALAPVESTRSVPPVLILPVPLFVVVVPVTARNVRFPVDWSVPLLVSVKEPVVASASNVPALVIEAPALFVTPTAPGPCSVRLAPPVVVRLPEFVKEDPFRFIVRFRLA